MTDHWDGPAAKDNPDADITDFFAFPIMEGEERQLVLILNVFPAATSSASFSDEVDYTFRVHRIAAIDGPRSKPKVHTNKEEFRITCRVTPEQGNGAAPSMTCRAQNLSAAGAPASDEIVTTVPLNDTSGGSNPRLRVFAGLRADTSFTDLARVRMPVWRDTSFANMPGVNSMAKHNVLSLVTTIAVSDVLGGVEDGALFAAVAETLKDHREGQDVVKHRIDRMGRPEINVWVIQDDDLRDLWNAEDTFNLNPAHVRRYIPALQSGLSRLDNFEKSLTGENVVDWETPHPMIGILLDDFLIVDVLKPTTPSSTTPGYLEIIQSYFYSVEHKTCGGRVPNEDVIGATLTWFINGPERPEPYRGSGVTAPDKPVTDVFPYLQPPTLDLGAMLEKVIAAEPQAAS
jgi:hypothetical protein